MCHLCKQEILWSPFKGSGSSGSVDPARVRVSSTGLEYLYMTNAASFHNKQTRETFSVMCFSSYPLLFRVELLSVQLVASAALSLQTNERAKSLYCCNLLDQEIRRAGNTEKGIQMSSNPANETRNLLSSLQTSSHNGCFALNGREGGREREREPAHPICSLCLSSLSAEPLSNLPLQS